MNKFNRKMFYVFVGCIALSVVIIGATYAYFTASVTSTGVVRGESQSVTFGMLVERVTTIDMAFGLIPMKNAQAPYAANHMCKDSLGNAGCQMYKITINANSDMVMFLDGYIDVTPRDERLEVRFTQIFPNNDDENFYTKFTDEQYNLSTFVESDYIKTGKRVSDSELPLNRIDDAECLFVSDEQIGGDMGQQKIFYVMIWVFDNGEAQDYLQGMELAYNGRVTFVTAQGNEIKATFD